MAAPPLPADERLHALDILRGLALFGMILVHFHQMVQAVVIAVLASGNGLALKLRPYAYLPAAIALFGVEAILSRAWLARFRHGPLEWLWRSATYATWPPLRRPRIAAADTAARIETLF